MIVIRCLDPNPRPLDERPEGAGPGWWVWGELLMFRCPNDHDCHLGHEIAVDGTATPSLVCPVPGCGFHEFVQLDGYQLGARAKVSQFAAREQRWRELGL